MAWLKVFEAGWPSQASLVKLELRKPKICHLLQLSLCWTATAWNVCSFHGKMNVTMQSRFTPSRFTQVYLKKNVQNSTKKKDDPFRYSIFHLKKMKGSKRLCLFWSFYIFSRLVLSIMYNSALRISCLSPVSLAKCR